MKRERKTKYGDNLWEGPYIVQNIDDNGKRSSASNIKHKTKKPCTTVLGIRRCRIRTIVQSWARKLKATTKETERILD